MVYLVNADENLGMTHGQERLYGRAEGRKGGGNKCYVSLYL